VAADCLVESNYDSENEQNYNYPEHTVPFAFAGSCQIKSVTEQTIAHGGKKEDENPKCDNSGFQVGIHVNTWFSSKPSPHRFP
jgi:hypothetical protein